MMARLIKGTHKPNHVPKLNTAKGDTVTSPAEIAQTFQNFYQRLYEHVHTDHQEGWGREFLAHNRLGHLTQDQLEEINAPITLEEIEDIIKSLPKNKAPGPDGLSGDFYKILRDEITPTLLEMYSDMWDGASYLPSGLEAYIKRIPKPGKDLLEPVS